MVRCLHNQLVVCYIGWCVNPKCWRDIVAREWLSWIHSSKSQLAHEFMVIIRNGCTHYDPCIERGGKSFRMHVPSLTSYIGSWSGHYELINLKRRADINVFAKSKTPMLEQLDSIKANGSSSIRYHREIALWFILSLGPESETCIIICDFINYQPSP